MATVHTLFMYVCMYVWNYPLTVTCYVHLSISSLFEWVIEILYLGSLWYWDFHSVIIFIIRRNYVLYRKRWLGYNTVDSSSSSAERRPILNKGRQIQYIYRNVKKSMRFVGDCYLRCHHFLLHEIAYLFLKNCLDKLKIKSNRQVNEWKYDYFTIFHCIEMSI